MTMAKMTMTMMMMMMTKGEFRSTGDVMLGHSRLPHLLASALHTNTMYIYDDDHDHYRTIMEMVIVMMIMMTALHTIRTQCTYMMMIMMVTQQIHTCHISRWEYVRLQVDWHVSLYIVFVYLANANASDNANA